jgi:hypothetical protein
VTATTTPEPEYHYRAQTDPTVRTWHLGAVERGAACFCGVRLLAPDDTRAFALKVPADRRNYQTDPDVATVTCKGCRRNREWMKATAAWKNATGAARPAAAPRGTATITEAEAAAMAGAAADRTVDATARPSRRRGRRAVTGDPRADRAANAEAAGNAR